MEDIDTRLALETYAERYGEFGLPQRDDSYAILCSLCLAPESFTEPLGVTLRKLVSRDIGLRAFLAVMAANRGLDAAVAHATPEHDLIARLGEPYVLQRFAALESVSQLFTPEVVGLPEAHTLKMKALYAALLDACDRATAEATLTPRAAVDTNRLRAWAVWVPYLAFIAIAPEVFDRFMRRLAARLCDGHQPAFTSAWEDSFRFTPADYAAYMTQRFAGLFAGAENAVLDTSELWRQREQAWQTRALYLIQAAASPQSADKADTADTAALSVSQVA
jgi:hypothetical protein